MCFCLDNRPQKRVIIVKWTNVMLNRAQRTTKPKWAMERASHFQLLCVLAYHKLSEVKSHFLFRLIFDSVLWSLVKKTNHIRKTFFFQTYTIVLFFVADCCWKPKMFEHFQRCCTVWSVARYIVSDGCRAYCICKNMQQTMFKEKGNKIKHPTILWVKSMCAGKMTDRQTIVTSATIATL